MESKHEPSLTVINENPPLLSTQYDSPEAARAAADAAYETHDSAVSPFLGASRLSQRPLLTLLAAKKSPELRRRRFWAVVADTFPVVRLGREMPGARRILCEQVTEMTFANFLVM